MIHLGQAGCCCCEGGEAGPCARGLWKCRRCRLWGEVGRGQRGPEAVTGAGRSVDWGHQGMVAKEPTQREGDPLPAQALPSSEGPPRTCLPAPGCSVAVGHLCARSGFCVLRTGLPVVQQSPRTMSRLGFCTQALKRTPETGCFFLLRNMHVDWYDPAASPSSGTTEHGFPPCACPPLHQAMPSQENLPCHRNSGRSGAGGGWGEEWARLG